MKALTNQMFQNIKEKLNGNQDAIEKAKLCWQEACNKEMAISQELWAKRENWHKEQELNGTLELQRNPQRGQTTTPQQSIHLAKNPTRQGTKGTRPTQREPRSAVPETKKRRTHRKQTTQLQKSTC